MKQDQVSDGSTDTESFVLGIDPGKRGALAFLSLEGYSSAECVQVMPTVGKDLDLTSLLRLLEERPVKLAVIEKATSRPGQGSVSIFTYGKGYGQILGLLAALRLQTLIVTPQMWKKKILEGTPKDKAAAILYCDFMYPHISLLPTSRSRVPHDGMADALCIASYGFDKLSSQRSNSSKNQEKEKI